MLRYALSAVKRTIVRTERRAWQTMPCRLFRSNLGFLVQLATVALMTIACPAISATNDVCDRAARQAAAESGVPVSVLWSITRTETGRARKGKLEPWPWTVNMEGDGRWFANRRDAQDFVDTNFARGARSFDVGCFQINYKWHGASFRSIDHMFDPVENARYAAAFLLRLYRESGDWSKAAGAYHSRTPEYANRYRARFDRIRKGHNAVRSRPPEPPRRQTQVAAAAPTVRQNNYPLLTHTGSSSSKGSLVPLHKSSAKALITLPGISEGS